MTVTSPRYALPNKHHDIVEDINNLRTTLRTVDSDIHSVEEAIPALSDRVPEVQNTVVCVEGNLANTEIQNIEANRYLVVNRRGDGFECVESGGEPGGKTGECCIKRSDKNVDMAWGDILNVSKNGMTAQENAETSQKNETHIFVDEAEIENDEQLPKVELTNYQVKSDVELESNSAVIVCDAVEKIEEKAIEIATNQNYGFVKVGNGFTNNDGTISVPVISIATENSVGIIKAGNGLNNERGVISRADLDPATFSSFGVIKLGNGLSINENEEMETCDMSGAIIYDLGRVKICNNGIVELEESTLRYRLFVTENILVQPITNFVVQDDFSFVLEIVSDGSHLVVFNKNLVPAMTELPVNRGITRMMFTKKIGVPAYNVEISRLDAPDPVLLTPVIDSCITSEFSVTAPNGGTVFPNAIVKTSYNGYCDINELNFKFETLVCVDYVYYVSESQSSPMGEFILRGSNDGKNWTTLLYRNGEIIYGKVYTDVKGCFRYYNLKIGYTANNNRPGGVTLWGTQIDNNESELTILTPYMSSDTTAFATMTGSNITDGTASALTDLSLWPTLRLTKTGDDWVKYEFPEAKIANVLELNYRGTGETYGFYGDRQPNWFKLEGSNDDSIWTLLLERQYRGNEIVKQNNVLFYEFNNQTAYKYYKFTCIATNSSSTEWGLTGFKLYRRSVGKHNLYNLVPTLSSNSQDGYEVSTSSNYNDSHIPFYVFDNNASTNWGTQAPTNNNPEWLQIKLPAASICNIVTISARPTGDNIYKETPTEFDIQGSNDGESWDTLTSQTGVTWTSNGQTQRFSFENETAYLYYRILMKNNTYIASGTNKPYSFGEIVFGHELFEYKRLLNKYEYLVPVMSSNSQDGYIASAKTQYSNTYAAWKAFNRTSNNGDDGWAAADNAKSDANQNCDTWLQIQLPEAQIANVLYLRERSGGSNVTQDPRDFTLKASNDGENWTILLTQADQSYTEKTWEFENDTAYSYYRLCITRTNQANAHVSVGIMNLIHHEIITEY